MPSVNRSRQRGWPRKGGGSLGKHLVFEWRGSGWKPSPGRKCNAKESHIKYQIADRIMNTLRKQEGGEEIARERVITKINT